MILEDLPDELICVIASHLDGGVDSANWRLTSKHFARIVAEAHFHTFAFGLGKLENTVERGMAVSLQMTKHVKQLQYNGAKGWTTQLYSHHHPPCELLSQVAEAFQLSGTRITVMHAQNLRFDFFASDLHVDTFARACASAKDLRLDFEGPIIQPSMRPEAERAEGNFRDFLVRLDGLEVLSLIFRKRQNHPCSSHRLRDLVPLTHTWPRLRTLEVHSLYFIGPDLVEILRNHSASLVSLDVTGMTIKDSFVLGGRVFTAFDCSEEGFLASKEETRRGCRELIEQLGKMSLRHVVVSEHRGSLPRIECGQDDDGVVESCLDAGGGNHVKLFTNLLRYLVDDESEEESYWGEGGGE